MTGFPQNIDFISDGEDVKAGTPNRPLRQLADRTQYLQALLQALQAGGANVLPNQILEAAVLPGQPVYFRAGTNQFERGLAAVDTDASGLLVHSASAHVWGLVLAKHSNTLGDILLGGVAEIDLSNTVTGPVVPGVYYLSASTPGKLTNAKPPLGVIVAFIGAQVTETTHRVLINNAFSDFAERHQHYRFPLVASPAGDHSPPAVGERHTITGTDNSQEGWLPADDDIFEGNAPEGAVFGYNLSASAVGQIWPPLPLQSAYLEINRGEEASQLGMGVPLGQDQLAVIDAHGIWWMSDCYGDVPWPTALDTAAAESLSLSETPECPRDLAMLLMLYFSKPVFFSASTAVLSLVAKSGSGLSFRCPNTELEKSTGHLEADLDLALLVASDTAAGHLVFKTLTGQNFARGPVVSGIRSASPELELASTVDAVDGYEVAQVTLAINNDITGREIPVDTVRLDGAEQEAYRDVLAIGFSPNRAAAYVGKLIIPNHPSIVAGTQLVLRFVVLGRVAGTLGSSVFSLTYRRLALPAAVLTDKVALATSDTALPLPSGTTFDVANQYVLLESNTFAVAAGDVIIFRLSRAAPDGYAGELHVLRQRGALIPPG